MKKWKLSVLPLVLLFFLNQARAQLITEVMFTKGLHPSVGTGVFLENAFALDHSNSIIVEPNFDFFVNSNAQWVFIFPLLAGFRHNFSAKGSGWYIQPVVGYTLGNT